MSGFEFTPEDFKGWPFSDERRHVLARHCNDKLREWLERAPVLYGSAEFGWWSEEPQPKGAAAHHVDTHHARLVCVERLGG